MRTTRLTGQALKLYRQIIELQNDTVVDQWEAEGGKRRLYLNTCLELHMLLDRKPWETTIEETIGEDVPPGWLPADKIDDRLSAQAIRLAPDAADLR